MTKTLLRDLILKSSLRLFETHEDWIERGEFRVELPVPIISMAIFGMTNWIFKWYQKEGKYSIDEIADIYISILFFILCSRQTN